MMQLSPAATREIERFQKTQLTAQAMLRLGVQSGGCLGMIYSMRLDDLVLPGDRIYELNLVQVVVDSHSLPYLEGVVLDYSEDLMGGAFRFYNPRAIASCECGHSFVIAER